MSPSLKVTDQHLQTSVPILPVLVCEIFLSSLSARQIRRMSNSAPTTVFDFLAGDLFGVSTKVLCFSNKLKYSSETVEGGEEVLATFGVLTSPNYPQDYPNSQDSEQEIRVAEGKTIKMRFTDFSTEARYDYVVITDDGTDLTTESGGKEPYPGGWLGPRWIVSKTNRVLVKFHTNGNIQRKGWRLEWNEQ